MKNARYFNVLWAFLLCGLVALSPTAVADILEDFPFSDPNGTQLGAAANTANPGNLWFEDPDMTESSVQNGLYRIEKANFSFGSNGLDIADITAGTRWLVAEFGGWNIAGNVVSGDEEQIRFTFLNNETADPPGSTITAQVQIARIDTDAGTTPGRLEIEGSALGTGGTNIAPATLNLTQNDPFTVVLELNKDLNTYAVFYQDGADPFVQLGTGNVDSERNGNTMRMVVNNNFGDGPGEFVDINRIYLTDANPVPEPAGLTLFVLAMVFCGSQWRKERRDTGCRG